MSQNLSRGRRHACEFNLPLNDPNYDAALQYWKVQIDESYEWELKRRYITDVSGQVTIDGNTQPGGRANAPKIMVNTNRDNLPTFGVSLEVRTSNNVIRNLGFIGGGQIILYEGNNLVENNWMGLKANGSGLSLASTASTQAARSLARGGIILPNEDSDNNIIRGNRIIGAFERAIRITSGGDNNLIEANYIGMDSQGHVPAPHDTGVNCARELDYNASLWYGGRGIQVTGDNNTVTNNRLVGLHVPQSTNDTPPITMEIAGVGNTVTLNVIGRDLAGKDAGVCGQGMLLQGTELLVENNLIVHTRNGFDPGDDGTDFDSAILTQSFAAGSGRWITVRKNMVIDAGAATHPDHVYRFASPGVPVELRKFNPAKVSGINGTSVTGTQGDDAVLPGPTTISAACPNCRIYLYADDLDGRIEAKEFLSEATADASGNWTATLSRSLTADEGLRTQSMAMANGVIHFYGAGTTSKLSDYLYTKRVFGLVIDFGTSQSPKSTRPLTTHWCPSRPGHQALRNNFASSLLLRTWLPMTGRRVRRPTLFSLWRKARRENSAASRLLGSTSLRFALHGWQRESPAELPLAQANYDVDETAGSVSVTVNRSSSSAGQVSVGYATVDNTAMSGSDYVSSSGTLTLQNGETSKSLNISIDDDAKAVNTLRWS
ncbi:Calx-beta domain-containing protein [Thiolapillus sp.]|uniref:Calx-beta domain-containing protein n=5 Tax=Thiolapillus sp. TaxID=2017437 RepID=UPI0025DA427F|nr:Calx-beta domain-containing protein [Thiolapillus sp.]